MVFHFGVFVVGPCPSFFPTVTNDRRPTGMENQCQLPETNEQRQTYAKAITFQLLSTVHARGTITVRRSRLFREKRPDGKKSTWLEAGTQISTRRRASGSTKAVCSTSGTTGSEKLSSEFVCHCEHAISTSAHLLFHGRGKVFPQQVSPMAEEAS